MLCKWVFKRQNSKISTDKDNTVINHDCSNSSDKPAPSAIPITKPISMERVKNLTERGNDKAVIFDI